MTNNSYSDKSWYWFLIDILCKNAYTMFTMSDFYHNLPVSSHRESFQKFSRAWFLSCCLHYCGSCMLGFMFPLPGSFGCNLWISVVICMPQKSSQSVLRLVSFILYCDQGVTIVKWILLLWKTAIVIRWSVHNNIATLWQPGLLYLKDNKYKKVLCLRIVFGYMTTLINLLKWSPVFSQCYVCS